MGISFAQFGNPPSELINNAKLTISIVDEIFSIFPNQFKFSSGYRTPQHNSAVGGVSNSYHVKALAADFTPLNGNFDYYKNSLIQIVSKYGFELIDERNKNHFHIEPSPNGIKIADSSNSSSNNTVLFVAGILILVLLMD